MDAQVSSLGHLTQTPAASSSTLSSSLVKQFYSAITSGDVKRAHQIISEVAPPEIDQLKLGPDGLSPLHVACEHGQEEIVQLLLAEYKCSIESYNSTGQSALHIAAQNGRVEIVKVLHQNWGQLSKREQLGSNDTGSSHELDQDSKPISEGVSREGLPHLSKGIVPSDSSPSSVDTATLETLSEPSGLVVSFDPRAQGLSISFQFSCDISGNTALHLAAAGGQVPVVQYLLREVDCSPTLTNNENQNAVHLAAKYGHVTTVQVLVEVHKERHVQRSIIPGSISSSDNDGGSLASSGLFTPDINGDTPLHLAYAHGQLPVVQYLLCEVKCSLTLVNNKKQNAVHLASKHGHVDLIKFLVETFEEKLISLLTGEVGEDGQSLTLAQDSSKECSTTLNSLSQGRGSASLCGLLTADINGNTPLHLAIAHGQLPVIEYLLCEVNCNPTPVNNKGQSPFHLALTLDSQDVVKMLIHAIRDRNKKIVGSSDINLPGIGQENSVSSTRVYDGSHNGTFFVAENQTSLQIQDSGLSANQINSTDSDGNTVLHLAAAHGNLPAIEYLLHEGDCSPTLVNKTGKTAFHIAAKHGHMDIVKVLIEKINQTEQMHTSETASHPDKKGDDATVQHMLPDEQTTSHLSSISSQGVRNIDTPLSVATEVSTPDNNGDTPLHLAAAHGHLPIVQYLLHEAKCSPTLVNHEGQSAVHLAAKHGKEEIVKYLIEEGCSFTATDKHGWTPLYFASEGGHLGLVKYFTLDRQCDPNTKTTKRWIAGGLNFRPGRTPLHNACRKGHLDIVKFLVEELKCDPCCTDKDGCSSLFLACCKGHLEVITYFIESLQLDSPLANAPLLVAARNGCIEKVKHLIEEKKYSPTCTIDMLGFHGRAPIHFASIGGHLVVLKYLVDEQLVDPACTDENGITSLHIASRYGHLEVVKYFVAEKQCNILCKSNDLDTPLHWAAFGGHLDMLKYFIVVKHCSPMERGQKGVTPLHCASQGGHLAVIKFLVDEQQVDPACTCTDENGVTSLHLVSLYGHLEVVNYFVEEKQCNILCRSNDLDTPLHCAASEGHLDILKYFIVVKHCSPMERGLNGVTPLHCASQGGHLAVMKFLVDEQQVDPACTDEGGVTSLHFASGNGHLEAVKYFVEKNESDILCKSSNGDTPLHYAANGGHLDILKYFIVVKHCSPMEKDLKGMTPLHCSSQRGHLAVIKYLVDEQQVDPACTDEDGFTSLHFASIFGHLEAVKHFVEEKQGDILCRNSDGDSPLHYAAFGGHLDILKYFIVEKHCSPMERGRKNRTPLHHASHGGHLAVVKYLIKEHNVDPSCMADNNTTPLHMASAHQALEVVQYLVEEENCNIMSVNSSEETPLHYAAGFGSFNVTQYLVCEKNCNVMAKNKVGATPFHLAVQKGHLSIVKYLADHHADLFLPDKGGLTPLHFAVLYGHLDVVKYLVGEKHCDPVKTHQALVQSPAEVALHLCTLDTKFEDIAVYLLGKCTILNRGDEVLKPVLEKFPTLLSSVNVFIVGYRSSGKSTLTKALCDENSPVSGRLFDVRGIVPHTAGIIPVEFQSDTLGKITLLDFAGHEEYYGSHETLLESITHPVILITVDLQFEKSQLLKALKYWISLVSRGMKKKRTQANVIIIGSHCDKLKTDQVLAKTSLLDDFVQSQQLQDVNCVGWVNMDCRKSTSNGMTKLRQLLKECCKLARRKSDFNNYANLLHLFLSQKLTHRQAITFSQLLDTLISNNDHEFDSLKSPPLLLEACESLNASGHIIFLKSDEIEKSWIIVNKGTILSMANGILKCIHTDENNAGIVPWSLIKEKTADPSLVVEYMLKMEFCSEVDPRSLQLIRDFDQRSPGRHFFFPDLISVDCPEDISQPNPQYTYSFGWTLRCIDSSFFTPRFLQLLLVRLACKFALIPHPNTPTLLSRNKGCRIWKNGIRWVSAHVVEAIVEVTEMNTAVVIVLRCKKDNNESVMHFLQLRSELIREVFSIKDETLETHESLYLPQCLQQYPPSTNAIIPMSQIAQTIVNKEPSIVVDNPFSHQCIMVKDLLLYEPFEKFGAEIIKDLFSHQKSQNIIPSKTFDHISVAAEDTWNRMASILEVDIAVVRRTELDQSKTEIDKCRSILHHWSQSKGTYSQLCQQLSSCSIFSRRNPLDLFPHHLLPHSLPEVAAVTTTETIIPSLTMASVPTLKQLQNLEKQKERLELFPELVPYWEDLAVQLDFPYHTIEQIKIDNRKSADQCREMLSTWLGPQSPSSQEPTWESLITALKNTDDLVVLASKLEKIILAQ